MKFFKHTFKLTSFVDITIGYLYIYMVVYGYLCYINYKKAVTKIKERMTLEF